MILNKYLFQIKREYRFKPDERAFENNIKIKKIKIIISNF